MNLLEMAEYSLKNLRHKGIRSWLTILGIVVGITAVVVLVGLAQGLRDQVGSQLQSFGPTTIIIAPYSMEGSSSSSLMGGASSASLRPSSGKLYDQDVERLKKIGDIETITRVIMGRTVLGYKGKEITASVYAIDPSDFKETVTFEIDKGRFLDSADRRVAVLGSDVANDSFETKIDLNSVITIGGQPYRVVGVMKKSGNSFAQTDSVIFIQFDEGRDMFSNTLIKNEISAIRIIVRDGASMPEVSQEIEDILISSHKVTKDTKDFTVVSPEFINNQVDSIMGMVTAFLGGIAGISLLIGGIGISNTMFMSVLERRKEIGVLKSLGATEEEIKYLFSVESAMIGVFGGVVGITFGWLVLVVISAIANFPASFTPIIGFGALAFSAIIGVVAGYIPAGQAAKLDPIEALRYE
jgi:putative ABC transport system permease protein